MRGLALDTIHMITPIVYNNAKSVLIFPCLYVRMSCSGFQSTTSTKILLHRRPENNLGFQQDLSVLNPISDEGPV
jgi:hypothetical protein